MNSRRLVVGNWKMNPTTLDEARRIARKVRVVAGELKRTDVVIAPPFPFIVSCVPRRPTKNFYVGAQSVSSHIDEGPFTGEVSAHMVADSGVRYAIIGHSEERKRGDSDEIVSRRLKAALDVGLKAIVCVGETVRDTDGAYLEVLKGQIGNSCAGIPKNQARNIILAYEPVWAIGAAEPMKSEDVYEMSLFVKKIFADVFTPDVGVQATVLYGGAVNFRNAADIITIGKVDGLLVGRESVNLAGFVELVRAVDDIKAL